MNHSSFVSPPPVIIKHYTAAASIQAEAASFAQVTPCDCRCQATPASTKPTPTSPKYQPPSHSKAFTSQTRKLPQWTPGWHVTFVECTIYRTADDPDYAKTGRVPLIYAVLPDTSEVPRRFADIQRRADLRAFGSEVLVILRIGVLNELVAVLEELDGFAGDLMQRSPLWPDVHLAV
jgi:hypothetical protein